MRQRGFLFAVLALVTVLGGARDAKADLIVAPNSLATVEGNFENSFPFGVSNTRYQQVYESSQFTTAGFISAIAFRPDATFGIAFSVTLPNIQINLSTTAMGPDGLSSTFAANVGADDTIVHSGALALSSSDTGPLAGPKDFDIVIALSTPFFYDPSAGNLLLDVRNFVGASTSIGFFDATGSASDSTSRVYSVGGVNNVTALNNNTAGLVTQFDIAPIPEPGSVVLVATGLGCMAFWRRGRRTRVRRSRAV